MTEAVILTKEEYQDLLKKSVVDERHDIVLKEDLDYYKACAYTLDQYMNVTRLCPVCGKAVMVSGYVCPACGYDSSYTVNEWNKINEKR